MKSKEKILKKMKSKYHSEAHHITIQYLVKKLGGNLSEPTQFDRQDSHGSLWVFEKKLQLKF